MMKHKKPKIFGTVGELKEALAGFADGLPISIYLGRVGNLTGFVNIFRVIREIGDDGERVDIEAIRCEEVK